MISPDVVILTRAELATREEAAFQRGVRRGMFEATTRDSGRPPKGGDGTAPGAGGQSGGSDSERIAHPAHPVEPNETNRDGG